MTAKSALFQPLTLREVTLKNRIVISPMCQHSSTDGFATDWHLVHYGKFALGGAGLIFTESTAVSSDARVGHGDLGIWSDDHVAGLRRVTDFVHANRGLIGVQLAHPGRKAFSQTLWDGGRALSPEALDASKTVWRRIGPSPIAAGPEWSEPEEMSLGDIKSVIDDFVTATHRADAAGFDVVELHCGHGYLAASFLSPLANHRTDEYGGSRENRMRFTVETAQAVRAAWPVGKPLFVRLSCHDGARDSWDLEDTVALASALKAVGVDVIDCSSGGLSEETHRVAIPRGLGFQVPFSEQVRKEADVTTQAVGIIIDPLQAEAILNAKKADLIAIGREALRDPYWPHMARKQLEPEADHSAYPLQHGIWLDKRAPVMRQIEEEDALTQFV